MMNDDQNGLSENSNPPPTATPTKPRKPSWGEGGGKMPPGVTVRGGRRPTTATAVHHPQ